MRTKTQFIISIITFTLILLIIGASVALTQQQIIELNNRKQLAEDVQTGASDLNYISNNYFLYQDNSSITLWETKFSTLSNDLAALNSTDPYQQALVSTVKTDLEHLNTVFNGVITFLSNAPRNVSIRVLPSFQTQWNRMAVQFQSLAFDSQQLSQALSDQASQATLASGILTVAFLGLFAGYFILAYLIMYRKTLKSISRLQEGIGVIGSGNLDYTIDAGKNDEISDISNSINLMTNNLKNVTASKAELEKEIEERKKAEEKLLHTQVKLEENAIQLEEYTSQLEELAEQRANKLKDAERLAAIGATAGMVGHDIRNPLQAITGDIYLTKTDLESLPESAEKKSIEESLFEIEKNIDYINKIVADLQDYARPLNPKSEKSDFKEIVERLLAKNGLPENIEVSVNVDENARKINADSYYLNRIMYNLITNSIQAMPEGGKLTIQTHKEPNNIIIDVKDTGVGIPKEIRDKMFTVMFTTKSKGQGFGLPVVKRMTESLGGTVSFESQEGKGTTFTLCLPL
jgi:signal transduction histidine kinase